MSLLATYTAIGLSLFCACCFAGLGWACGFISGVQATVGRALNKGLEIEGVKHALVPTDEQGALKADAASWREYRGW